MNIRYSFAFFVFHYTLSAIFKVLISCRKGILMDRWRDWQNDA